MTKKTLTPAAAPAAPSADPAEQPVIEQPVAEPAAPAEPESAPDPVAEAQADAPPAAPELVKARVLAHCAHGKPDDVIEIDAALAESLEGVVDTDPAAVAYAESLK